MSVVTALPLWRAAATIAAERIRVPWWVALLVVVGILGVFFVFVAVELGMANKENRQTAAKISEILSRNPFLTEERGLDFGLITALPDEQRQAAVEQTVADLEEIDALLAKWDDSLPTTGIGDTGGSQSVKERKAVAQLIEELQTAYPETQREQGRDRS